jgi:hypothetical protein
MPTVLESSGTRRRQRERESAGKNGYGEVRTRCRMDNVQNTTQVQSHEAMRSVRRGQRSVFDPNLFVLRDHSREQSER